jgi:capsular polysaccharide biosynthesis protein
VSLKEYAAAVRAGWLVVAGALVASLLIAAAVSANAPRYYRAEAVVYFSIPPGETPGELERAPTLAQAQVRAFALTATTPLVLDRVRSRLALSLPTAELADRVRVRTPIGTVIASISVSWPDPEGAARIADAVGVELTGVVQQLAPSAEASGAVRVALVTPAQVPTLPFGVHTRLNLLVGGFVGGSIGVLAAVALDARRRRRREHEHRDREHRGGQQEVAIDEAEGHLL